MIYCFAASYGFKSVECQSVSSLTVNINCTHALVNFEINPFSPTYFFDLNLFLGTDRVIIKGFDK